jgi:transposase
VFVDESGVTTTMARRYGRGPKGARVHGDVPLRGWQVTTLLGALALDGVRALRTVEAATDTDVFQAFVEQVLGPALRPGDVVVWDNLAPHKDPEVEARVRQAGATVLRLPPYSPDFNPIESCWSKVKTRLRGAAARSKDALDTAIQDAWQAVTPQDARGWFTLCGYRVPS